MWKRGPREGQEPRGPEPGGGAPCSISVSLSSASQAGESRDLAGAGGGSLLSQPPSSSRLGGPTPRDLPGGRDVTPCPPRSWPFTQRRD